MSARSPRRRRDPIRLCSIGAAAALGMAWPVSASACGARAGPIVADDIGYDPFANATTQGWVRFDVTLSDGDACDVIVALTDEGGALAQQFRVGPAGEVVFRPELRPSAAAQPSVNTAEARVRLTSAAPRARLEWHLRAQSDVVLPPGDFATPVLAVVRAPGANPSPPVRGSITIHSVARAQANLAGVAGRFSAGSSATTIDLGELVTGKTGFAVLQVRANITAHLSLRSANRGYLVNAAVPAARVPYAMTLDGVPVDLTAPATRTIDPPRSIEGSALPIGVTVGEVRGALAGRYSDTVTIDIF